MVKQDSPEATVCVDCRGLKVGAGVGEFVGLAEGVEVGLSVGVACYIEGGEMV